MAGPLTTAGLLAPTQSFQRKSAEAIDYRAIMNFYSAKECGFSALLHEVWREIEGGGLQFRPLA